VRTLAVIHMAACIPYNGISDRCLFFMCCRRLAGAAQFVMATCVVTDIQMESLQGMDGPREGPLLPAIVLCEFSQELGNFPMILQNTSATFV